MTENIELTQEVEQDIEVEFAPRPKEVLSTPHKNDHKNGTRLESQQWAHEEILKLVQQTFLLQAQKVPRTVLFAGLDRGTSCSQICLLVADTLKRIVSGSVCLVEADFRSPSLTALLGTTNHHGLADSLLKDGPIRSFAKPLDAGHVWLLSCGLLDRDSPDLLNANRIKSRFAELRNEFEYVIVNAPSLSHYADATALGRLTDGLVLVLEANSTRKDKALKIMKKLQAAQIPVLGAILNNRSFPIPSWLYHRL
jgi:receptor protein-tyrosine kinase